MFALVLALVVAAPGTRTGPSIELPGLERPLQWGMSSQEVASVVRGFAWLGPEPANKHGMAGGSASVAGRPATLIFQFGRDRLAVVMVVYPVAAGDDGKKGFAEVGRALRNELGSPARTETTKRGPEKSQYRAETESWRVRGTEITHWIAWPGGGPQHGLHASDARHPDYGEPGPDYAFK
jgi:hypothetical protein